MLYGLCPVGSGCSSLTLSAERDFCVKCFYSNSFSSEMLGPSEGCAEIPKETEIRIDALQISKCASKA